MRAAIFGPERDAELVALAAQPLPGPISVSYRRERGFFHAYRALGDDFDVIGAERDGQVALAGVRAWRRVWIDGRPGRIGYISALKADPALASAWSLPAGYRLLRDMDAAEGRDPLYYCSFLHGSPSAALLSKPRPGLLRFVTCAELRTRCLFLKRPARIRAGASRKHSGVECGEASDFPGLIEFLDREGSAKQLRPVAAEEIVMDRPDPWRRPPGPYWVLREAGRIRAALAEWDLRPLRSIRLEGYSPLYTALIAASRPLMAAAGFQGLPRPGQNLPLSFLALCASEANDPRPFRRLLESALAGMAARAGLAALSLDARDPLLRACAGLPGLDYRSSIATARWEDRPGPHPNPDRLFAPEGASL